MQKQGQNAFFDIHLTNTYARPQKHLPVNAILKKHQKGKKRVYNSRILNLEHGTLTILVSSLTGREGPETPMFHMHIAQTIANKKGENMK